ncbi:hypothetical protein FRB95_009191 [Tulasnella sp. JGI-2019a]|nr:hypothetical protein FRB95_009191 [Tulasnella sp. JGI-2019a]
MSLLLKCLWAIGLLLLPSIRCQTQSRRSPQTAAQCSRDYEWMFNTKGQSPCLIAAYLQGACFNDESWTINALGPDESYMPPDIGSVNPCQCNTVTYNALSACAACQNSPWVDFHAWIVSCPVNSVQVGYPFSIPNGTALPAWTLLDTSGGTFDVNAALKIASNGTRTSMYSNPQSSWLDPGAIAGIVIAGLFVIILLIAIFYVSKSLPFQGLEKVKPARLRTILLGDGRPQYAAIQKPPRRPLFLSLFKRRVSTEQADATFIIDNEVAPITMTSAPTGNDVKARSWHGRQLSSPWLLGSMQSPKQEVDVKPEDLGSVAGFPFVPSRRESQVSDVSSSPLITRIDPYIQSPPAVSETRRGSIPTMETLTLQPPPRSSTLDSKIVRPSKSTNSIQGTELLTQLETNAEHPRRGSSGHALEALLSPRSATLDSQIVRPSKSSSSLRRTSHPMQLESTVEYPSQRSSVDSWQPTRGPHTPDSKSVRPSKSAGNLLATIHPSQDTRAAHARRSSDHDVSILRPPPSASSFQTSMQSVQEAKPLHIPRRSSTHELRTMYHSEPLSILQTEEQVISEKQALEEMKIQQEVARRKQSADSLAILDGTNAMDVDETTSESSSRAYSPPIHRSRLEQLPTTAPAMMYPAGVRGTLRRGTAKQSAR